MYFFIVFFGISAFCQQAVSATNSVQKTSHFWGGNAFEFLLKICGKNQFATPKCAKNPAHFSGRNGFEMLKNYELNRLYFLEKIGKKRPKSPQMRENNVQIAQKTMSRKCQIGERKFDKRALVC